MSDRALESQNSDPPTIETNRAVRIKPGDFETANPTFEDDYLKTKSDSNKSSQI